MIDEATRQALDERLDAARANLLAALADVTERDFATDLGGVTVVQLLARVAGRSPLEYLSPEERARQRAVVIALTHAPPETVGELVERFVDEV